jgi:hypothetical protein
VKRNFRQGLVTVGWFVQYYCQWCLATLIACFGGEDREGMSGWDGDFDGVNFVCIGGDMDVYGCW